jgi:hypothetical protein
MSADFNARALELSITEYRVLRAAGDPLSQAAFGVAVMHLHERMNLSMLHACELLQLELERQALIASEREQMIAAQVKRAETARDLQLTQSFPPKDKEGET